MITNQQRTQHPRPYSGPTLEPLEPRQLLTAYFGQGLADYFHLPSVLLDNIAPPSGAVYADFGANAAGLGDLDGDSYGDFAISAPGHLNSDGSTDIAGAVFVFSGKTGAVIRNLSDGFAGFGTSIANIGDINGDGKADLAVGSANFDGNANGAIEKIGRAYVYSGADGAPILTLDGTGPADQFGHIVIGAGDVNADGTNDLVVSAPFAGPNAEGYVYFFSGATGEKISELTGEAGGDHFGRAVFTSAAVPGLAADFPSLIWIGAPGNERGEGRVYEFDALSREEHWRNSGSSIPGASAAGFGSAIVALVSSPVSGSVPLVNVVVGVPGATYWSGFKGSFPQYGAGRINVFRALTGKSAGGGGQDYSAEGGASFGSGLWIAGPGTVLVAQPGSSRAKFAVVSVDWHITAPSALSIENTGRMIDVGLVDGDLQPDLLVLSQDGSSAKLISNWAFFPPTFVVANTSWSFITTDPLYGEGAAFVGGQYRLYRTIPGLLSSDIIDGVNDSGLIVTRPAGSTTYFLVQGGVRTALADAVTTIDAPAGVTPNYAAFATVRVGNDGSIIFTETISTDVKNAWLFKDGVLTLLWAGGEALDVNSSGTILGRITEDTVNMWHYVLRSPEGVISPVSYLGFVPYKISDTGIVTGVVQSTTSDRRDVAQWKNGTLTILTSSITSLPITTQFRPEWTIIDTGPDSEALFSLMYAYGWTEVYRYDRQSGLVNLADAGFGWDKYLRYGNTRLGPSGSAVIDGFAIAPTGDTTLWEPADGAPITSNANTSESYKVAVNRRGDVILFVRSAAGWTQHRVIGMQFDTTGGTGVPVVQTFVFNDVVTHDIGIVLVTPQGTYIVERIGPWAAWRFDQGPFKGWDIPIVRDAAMFLSSDQKMNLVGTTPTGHVYIFYQIGKAYPGWGYSDLTTSDIEATGKTFVPVAGGLTTFTTPWGGMNIAYLDASGNAQVVWWAPGLAHWTINNLSQDAGFGGTFHGALVSYVTPWGGLNVAGTDANGNLVALWWAPGLAHWRSDRLVSGTPAQLDEDSLTAYVTPWGGLNIAGLDRSTGKLTAYWWTPGMATWTVQEFAIANAPADLHLTGRLSSAVSPTGDLFITAVTSDHHLANIWFGAATNYTWTFEDVTLAV